MKRYIIIQDGKHIIQNGAGEEQLFKDEYKATDLMMKFAERKIDSTFEVKEFEF